MVAVLNEIPLADLEYLDGRQSPGCGIQVHLRDGLPARSHRVGERQERAHKILVAPHTAHDLIQRDILYPAIGRVHEPQPLRYLVEVEQAGTVAAQMA